MISNHTLYFLSMYIQLSSLYKDTAKPVLSAHSKIDKAKVLKTNGCLMKVKSISECSLGAFCNTFDLHSAIIRLEKQFLVFFLSGPSIRFYCSTILAMISDQHTEKF